MLYTILKRVPGGQGTKVLVGTGIILGFGGLPFILKKAKSRPGHDLWSSEKPEAIEQIEEEKKKQRLGNVA